MSFPSLVVWIVFLTSQVAAPSRSVVLVDELPADLNLAYDSDYVSKFVRAHVAPSLLTYKDGVFLPAAAESFQVDDESFAIRLPVDATFSNGTKVLEGDLEQSLAECNVAAGGRRLDIGAIEIRIPTDSANLRQPTLERVAACPIYPQDVKAALSNTWGAGTKLVGVSRWVIERYVSSSRISLVNGYDRIEIVHESNIENGRRRLIRGDVNLLVLRGEVPLIAERDETLTITQCEEVSVVRRRIDETDPLAPCIPF